MKGNGVGGGSEEMEEKENLVVVMEEITVVRNRRCINEE